MRVVFAATLLLTACEGTPPASTTPGAPTASTPRATDEPAAIGSARLMADGTIELTLVARGPHGMLGDGRIKYPTTHAQYATVRAHLERAHGPLVVDRSVSVPPFP